MVGPFTQTLQGGTTTRYNDQFPLYATQYLRSDGGRFLTLDTGSGYYKLSVAADTQIDGWTDVCLPIGGTTNPSDITPFISSATNGASVVPGTKAVFNTDTVFLMPLKSGSTIAATNLDQEYDLAIEGSTTTTKQVLDITAQAQKVVKVLAVDIINNLAWVKAVEQS